MNTIGITQYELQKLQNHMLPHNKRYNIVELGELAQTAKLDLSQLSEFYKQLSIYYGMTELSYDQINHYVLQESLKAINIQQNQQDNRVRLQQSIVICQGSKYNLKQIIPRNSSVYVSTIDSMNQYDIQNNKYGNWRHIHSKTINKKVPTKKQIYSKVQDSSDQEKTVMKDKSSVIRNEFQQVQQNQIRDSNSTIDRKQKPIKLDKYRRQHHKIGVRMISIFRSAIAVITFNGELMVKPLPDFNVDCSFQFFQQMTLINQKVVDTIQKERFSSLRQEDKQIKHKQTILYFQGNSVLGGWVLITKQSFRVYPFLTRSQPILQHVLPSEAESVSRINDKVYIFMFVEPCVCIISLDGFCITSRIYNDLKYSAMCFNQRYSKLILADHASYLMKYSINQKFKDIQQDGQTFETQSKFSKANQTKRENFFIDKMKQTKSSLRSIQKTYFYSQSQYDKLMERAMKKKRYQEKSDHKQCRTPFTTVVKNAHRRVLTKILSVGSSIISYQKQEFTIKLWDIHSMAVYQTIKNSFEIDLFTISNQGLFITSNLKKYMAFYQMQNKQVKQNKKGGHAQQIRKFIKLNQICCVSGISLDNRNLYIFSGRTIHRLFIAKQPTLSLFVSKSKQQIRDVFSTNNKAVVLCQDQLQVYSSFGSLQTEMSLQNQYNFLREGVQPYTYMTWGAESIKLSSDQKNSLIIDCQKKIYSVYRDERSLAIRLTGKPTQIYVFLLQSLSCTHVLMDIPLSCKVLAFSQQFIVIRENRILKVFNIQSNDIVIQKQCQDDYSIESAKIQISNSKEKNNYHAIQAIILVLYKSFATNSFILHKYRVAGQKMKLQETQEDHNVFYGNKQLYFSDVIVRSKPKVSTYKESKQIDKNCSSLKGQQKSKITEVQECQTIKFSNQNIVQHLRIKSEVPNKGYILSYNNLNRQGLFAITQGAYVTLFLFKKHNFGSFLGLINIKQPNGQIMSWNNQHANNAEKLWCNTLNKLEQYINLSDDRDSLTRTSSGVKDTTIRQSNKSVKKVKKHRPSFTLPLRQKQKHEQSKQQGLLQNLNSSKSVSTFLKKRRIKQDILKKEQEIRIKTQCHNSVSENPFNKINPELILLIKNRVKTLTLPSTFSPSRTTVINATDSEQLLPLQSNKKKRQLKNETKLSQRVQFKSSPKSLRYKTQPQQHLNLSKIMMKGVLLPNIQKTSQNLKRNQQPSKIRQLIQKQNYLLNFKNAFGKGKA